LQLSFDLSHPVERGSAARLAGSALVGRHRSGSRAGAG
jgi:hypothetical protein